MPSHNVLDMYLESRLEQPVLKPISRQSNQRRHLKTGQMNRIRMQNMAPGEFSPNERMFMHGGDEPPISIHNPELPLLISGGQSEFNANAGLTTGDQ